jgi:hypothetical protein
MMDDLINDSKIDDASREQALNYKKDKYFDEYIYSCHTSSNTNSCLMTDRARVEAMRSVDLSDMGIFAAGSEISSFEKLVANFIKFLARLINNR